MKRYMVVVLEWNDDGTTTQYAGFFYDYGKAKKYKSTAECALGCYVELYERKIADPEYGEKEYSLLEV